MCAEHPKVWVYQVKSGIPSSLGPFQGAVQLGGTDLISLRGSLMLSQSLSTYFLYTLKNMEIMRFLQLISSSECPYFGPPANEE